MSTPGVNPSACALSAASGRSVRVHCGSTPRDSTGRGWVDGGGGWWSRGGRGVQAARRSGSAERSRVLRPPERVLEHRRSWSAGRPTAEVVCLFVCSFVCTRSAQAVVNQVLQPCQDTAMRRAAPCSIYRRLLRQGVVCNDRAQSGQRYGVPQAEAGLPSPPYLSTRLLSPRLPAPPVPFPPLASPRLASPSLPTCSMANAASKMQQLSCCNRRICYPTTTRPQHRHSCLVIILGGGGWCRPAMII